MICLKFLVTLCLVVAAKAGYLGLGHWCMPGTEGHCSGTIVDCWDHDNDGNTTCECTPAYYQNSTVCVAGTVLGSTCNDIDTPCIKGASCTDIDDDGSGDYCLCDPGYHAEGPSCVKNPGMQCTLYGEACGIRSTCSAVSGSNTIVTTCRCDSGYYTDGVMCVSGGNTVFVSPGFVVAAIIITKILY